jgi:hypothetical protein
MKFEYNDVILKIDKQLIIEIHKIFKFDYINYNETDTKINTIRHFLYRWIPYRNNRKFPLSNCLKNINYDLDVITIKLYDYMCYYLNNLGYTYNKNKYFNVLNLYLDIRVKYLINDIYDEKSDNYKYHNYDKIDKAISFKNFEEIFIIRKSELKNIQYICIESDLS